MGSIEYKIFWYIQLFDRIAVAAIPWLKWLTVACFYAAAAALAHWNVKRF